MKLFEAKGEIIQSGLFPGLPNQRVPLWTRGNNVLFRDASVKVGAAQSLLFTKLSPFRVSGITSVNNNGAAALVWGDRENLFKGTSAPTTVNVSSKTYTGTDEDLWSIVAFGTSILATNGVDEIQYLADITSGNFVDISTVSDLPNTFRCKQLGVIGPFVLALNTNNATYEFRWCDEDDPLTWQPAAENKARDLQIRDLLSDIVAVVDFSDSLVVFGRVQAHLISFIGAPFFFGQNHLISGIGASGKHSCVAVGRIIYGLGPNGIFATDGSEFNYIDNPAVHKHVFEDTLDRDACQCSVAWHDPNEDEIYFSYPLIGGGGATVSFNQKSRAWSMHDWYRTAAARGGIWLAPVSGGPDGGIWLQGGDGQAVSADAAALGVDDALQLTLGYGMGGYGQGGYGGSWSAE